MHFLVSGGFKEEAVSCLSLGSVTCDVYIFYS